MQNLPQYILDTFLTLWPTLRDNPHELAARLQRRRRALLTRPPRAWCIALRPGDTRMTPWDTVLDDCHAPDRQRPHTVTITAALVRRLCQPVYIDPWGEPAADVAARLGVNLQGLAYLMRVGFFRVRRVQGLGGKRGKPVPILHYDCALHGPLDPQSRSFRPPLPAWGSLWPYHANALPDDFEQPVRREPDVRPGRWGDCFQGWIWRCPACDRPTDKLYYPLPVPAIDQYLNLHPSASDADALSPPPPTFACGRCHRVTHLSRADPNSWNAFVTHLSAGLLYGREVPKPADWSGRRNTKARRPNARPALRRAEVCRLLTETDLTRADLAAHLGLSRGTINMHVEAVFDQYGVHSREELRERVAIVRRQLAETASGSVGAKQAAG